MVGLRHLHHRGAMRQGVNLVCADRVGESILPGLSVRENFFLNPLAAGRPSAAWLAPAEECADARRLGEIVGLRPNDPNLAIELLSGGNQQKVIVGSDRKIIGRGAHDELKRLIGERRSQANGHQMTQELRDVARH